jgi:hypothetical protein
LPLEVGKIGGLKKSRRMDGKSERKGDGRRAVVG